MSKNEKNFSALIDEARETFDAGMSASRRVFEEAGKAFSNTSRISMTPEDIKDQWGRVTKETTPFMKDATETATKAFSKHLEISAELVRNATDVKTDKENFDPQEAIQAVWTNSFEAAKNHVSTIADTSVAMFKAWDEHFNCCGGVCSKGETKAPKAAKAS